MRPEFLFPREEAHLGRQAGSALPIYLILTAACSLHALLAVLNAHGFRINNSFVIGGEMLIALAAAAPWIGHIRPKLLLIFLFCFANALLLWSIRGTADLKILRDLLVPVIFYELGRTQGSPALADRALLWLLLLTAGIAVWEMLAPESYGGLFQILAYYQARGVVPAEFAQFMELSFSVNGHRPESIGRTLFPELGPHRASSIFIEPVSLGNFAVITFAWFMFGRQRWPLKLVGFVLPAVLIVLADSRFGLMMLGVVVLVRIVSRVRLINMVMPFVPGLVMIGLTLLAWSINRAGLGDNILGRLNWSGRYILSLSPEEWLGLSMRPVYAFDSGYAYVILGFGVIGTVLLWISFAFFSANRLQQLPFKLFMMVLFACLLSISNSVFSLKTSGLLWFLFGCLAADQVRSVRTARMMSAQSRSPARTAAVHQRTERPARLL